MNKIIKEILSSNPSLKKEMKGLPDVGSRTDGEASSKGIPKLKKAIYFVSRKTKKIDKLNKKKSAKYSFASGNPTKFKPFKPAVDSMKKSLKSSKLYEYKTNDDSYNDRLKIIDYLAKEGFQNQEPHKDSHVIINGLSTDNVTFSISTTHAFTMVLSTIMRQHDVIIIPAPNYTLFSVAAERVNANIEFLDLCEEDEWLINPQKLLKKINYINKKLYQKYKDSNLGYIPRVKALLNCNPNNPTGKVMSKKNIDLLTKISDLSFDKNFFVIDDMVYRDICYDDKEIAKPLATLPKHFSNTITLFGLSKSYGLAAVRAGIIVADEVIIREIRNKIFQQLDSMPLIQIASLTGAFNATRKRYKYYDKYFKKLRKKYIFQYNIVVAFVDGVDAIKDKKIKKRITKLIKMKLPYQDYIRIINKGTQGMDFINKMLPEGGFFVLVDFSKLMGKTYNGITLNNDENLLNFFYTNYKVKFLIGSSFSYPLKERLVGRISFALEPSELIDSMYAIYKAINLLKLDNYD